MRDLAVAVEVLADVLFDLQPAPSPKRLRDSALPSGVGEDTTMDLPRLDVDRRLVSGWQPQSRAGTAAAADGPADAARGLLVDDEVVLLLSGQLDGLLATLAQAREANAASVREDIAALRLIPGTIRLLPTEGELTALRVALAAVVGGPFEPILEDGEPASSSASGEGGVRAERA